MALTRARTEISVRLVVLSGTRVLLASRRTQKWYFLPGGAVGSGETLENAARRLADEQAGLDIDELAFVGCAEDLYPDDGDQVHEMSVVFTSPAPWAAQVASHDPDLRISSVSLHELDDLELRPPAVAALVRRWVRDRQPAWRSAAAGR